MMQKGCNNEYPKIASREEWLSARQELLAREKEHTKLTQRITEARQALPWVKVEKDYVFETLDGPKSLDDLFWAAFSTHHLPFHVWSRMGKSL